MKNERLFKKLLRSIKNNERGNLSCYLRRLTIIYAVLLKKFKIYKVVRVPLFFRRSMKVVAGETVSSNIIAFGYSEVALTALMLNELERGDSYVDVGTHYGYESMLALELVGESGHVYSFEPNPQSFKLAQQNIKGKNAYLFNLAVGSSVGSVKMLNNEIARSAFNSVVVEEAGDNVIDVSVTTLDTILFDRANPIKLIKCDVEGFEIEVLRGAVDVINKDKPIVVLEAEMPAKDGILPRAFELKDFMASLGYTAYNFELSDDNLKLGLYGTLQASHANILFKYN